MSTSLVAALAGLAARSIARAPARSPEARLPKRLAQPLAELPPLPEPVSYEPFRDYRHGWMTGGSR